jgi:hypothetical protein
MLKKMFIFRGVHHVRSLLNLQRPSQIGLLLRSGLCATRAILALDELIIGLDRSINDERLLITHRTYLRLISILQPEGTNDGESQSHCLELSLCYRTEFKCETKLSISFSPAWFKIEKEASLIKTLSGPYEITWQLEKVLAYRQLTYTIKKY